MYLKYLSLFKVMSFVIHLYVILRYTHHILFLLILFPHSGPCQISMIKLFLSIQYKTFSNT